MIDEENEGIHLTFEGFLEAYDFAYGRKSAVDDMDCACAIITVCLALHQLNAESCDLTEFEAERKKDMPLAEMPDTAAALRARLRPEFERAVAEVEHGSGSVE